MTPFESNFARRIEKYPEGTIYEGLELCRTGACLVCRKAQIQPMTSPGEAGQDPCLRLKTY